MSITNGQSKKQDIRPCSVSYTHLEYSFLSKLEAKLGDLAFTESNGGSEVADSPVR